MPVTKEYVFEKIKILRKYRPELKYQRYINHQYVNNHEFRIVFTSDVILYIKLELFHIKDNEEFRLRLEEDVLNNL
jgi:hypothetical protein